MRQVVVGVGHCDEPLDQVGSLDQAEEHLKAQQDRRRTSRDKRFADHEDGRTDAYVCGVRAGSHLREPGDVETFAVLHGGLARLPGPGPLALAVGEAGPGEDVVVGQVQVSRVHGKLANELQQASQTVQQPLDTVGGKFNCTEVRVYV